MLKRSQIVACLLIVALFGCATAQRQAADWKDLLISINRGNTRAKYIGNTVMVDDIIGYVGARTITLQDIFTERLFMKITGQAMLFSPKQIDFILSTTNFDAAAHAVFNELVTRELIYMEADKLKVTQNIPPITDADVDAFKAKLREKNMDYMEFCRSVEITDVKTAKEQNLGKYRSLENYLYHWKVVDSFTKRRIDMQLRFSLDNSYENLGKKLAQEHPELTDSDVKQQIMTIAKRQRLREWVEELEQRNQVIMVYNWAEDLPEELAE